MAKRQPQTGLQTTERDGQLSAAGGLQNYFLRNIPLWNPPAWGEAASWRKFVEHQSIAAICRDTIANYLNSLEWAIVARDSDKRDELKPRIRHYTKLFERGNAYYWDMDFSTQVEWFVKDLFTLPFGTASELGRLDDDPNGRVVWIRPLDGGTLAPTLNHDYPIVQSAPGTSLQPIYFPREFIARVYLSPRTELQREGWGYAPPERIWRSIDMLSYGDTYYAKLLLDTPEAGVLDLGDMEQTTALNWVKSLGDLLFGISPLKIPVLYEHTTQAKWIPFGRPPSEILYDSVTTKYAAILAAGYGLTLSDIGFPASSSGGDTLAGTIRQERIGKASGKSIAKKKFEAYANRILPEYLKWTWIDYDDERNVSKGRARLASAQSAAILVDKRVFSPNEIRQQYLADGLISIDVPETIDPQSDDFNIAPPNAKSGGSRVKSLGNPVAPSAGGQGEVIPQQIVQRSLTQAEVGITKAVANANDVLVTLLSSVSQNLSQEEVRVWEEYVDAYLTGSANIEEDQLRGVLNDITQRARSVLETQSWVQDLADAICEKILDVQKGNETERAYHRLVKKAEDDFLEGKSDDLDVDEYPTVDLSMYADDLRRVVRENLSILVASYGILIAKNQILEQNLDVDSTERVSENIRVSREVSKEVLQNLSLILNSAFDAGSFYLVERMKEDAIS